MAADEATPTPPSPEDGHDRGDRAAAGVARFFRQHARGLIAGVVVAIAAYAALAGPGGGGGSDDGSGSGSSGGSGGSGGDAASTTTAPAGSDTTSSTPGSSATTAPGATEATDPAPTSTLVPPDVDSDRPAVDLAHPPDATDPVELARWWAGTYTAYIGAEPPADLVDRLADWTSPELVDELRALPLAASYDPPLGVEGVTAVDLPVTAGGSGSAPPGSRQLRVSVQTPLAVVVYDMTLVPGDGGAWLVREAERF
jgi:hypothetical protein